MVRDLLSIGSVREGTAVAMTTDNGVLQKGGEPRSASAALTRKSSCLYHIQLRELVDRSDRSAKANKR